MKNIPTNARIKKSVEFKVGSLSDEDAEYYYFEGYASTFGNVDRGNDIVVNGAFIDSLKEMMPAMLYQHDMDDVIGVYTKAYEDENGLFVRGMMPKAHSLASDVYALLKCGAINSMSIGFSINEYSLKGDKRYIEKVNLWEVSLVTIPMNPKAKITSVKKMEQLASIKDIERHLKNNYSMGKKERKTLISKIKSFSDRCDADPKEVTPRRDVDGSDSSNEPIKQKLDEILNTLKSGVKHGTRNLKEARGN